MILFVLALYSVEEILDELSSPQEALSFYSARNSSYTFQETDPYNLMVRIRINPCKEFSEYCCEGKNEAVCQDNLLVEKGPNLEFAWAHNNFVVICGNEFYSLEECGTFIELHKNTSQEVVRELRITTPVASGYHTEFLFTQDLEPGVYEFWWVQRNRNGRFVQYIKPFFLIE